MSDIPAADGSSEKRQRFPSAPPMVIDPEKRYTATMVTSKGTMVIELDPLAAPKTVNNFVFLARWHYYDGVVFHRVIPGFMLQGGDPEGTGRGGPGYQVRPTSCPSRVGTWWARWPWPTPGPIPTAASSSSSAAPTGSASHPCTPSSGRWCPAVRWYRPSTPSARPAGRAQRACRHRISDGRRTTDPRLTGAPGAGQRRSAGSAARRRAGPPARKTATGAAPPDASCRPGHG